MMDDGEQKNLFEKTTSQSYNVMKCKRFLCQYAFV